MKKRYNLSKILVTGAVMVLLGTSQAFAQLGDVGTILQSSKADANLLVEEYLKPFGKGFGASLNSGWTNTAKPHKKFGFDVTISAGLAAVPTSDKAFDVTQIGLQQLQLESGPSTAQTINGESDVATTSLAAYETIDGTQYKLFEFNMPTGTGFGFVPAPQIKGAVGLIKDTEIMFRFVPEIDIDDYGTFKQFGLGAKHGINQWLPGGKILPVDISIMAAFTNLTVTSGFDITAQDVITDPNNTKNTHSSDTWDGQGIEMNTDAFTVNALVGKTLPVISVYGGIGIETSTMTVATPGTYPTVLPNPNYPSEPEQFMVGTVDKPIDIEMEGGNSFHALAGFRLRFAVFHISASYTLANYSTLNAGFGISFR